MARILCVGIAVLDITATVERFPAEDDELRARALALTRGGNAANTLTVLQQYGHDCYWAGMLGGDLFSSFLIEDFQRHGIDLRYARREPEGRTPLSLITRNRTNGSRTIVHYRELREFDFEDFRRIGRPQFDWIHFEGRNPAQTRKMIEAVLEQPSPPSVSIEIEKPRPDEEQLHLPVHTVVFSSRYARQRGFADGKSFLLAQRPHFPRSHLVCAWGEQGATGLSADNEAVHCPAVIPRQVVDTLAAGDTFNAGLIHHLLRGDPLKTAIAGATALAGHKCGRFGLDNLLANQHP